MGNSQYTAHHLIEIDGSRGEGGGQVLRSSLTLSILTRRGFIIRNIRANRKKPGLSSQHLKAVDASATISKAMVEGASLGSTSLTFIPSGLRTGRYKFDIKTAGSTSLVLQTIFIPLSLASSASSVIITGGTHVSWSPSYHYLEHQWLPFLKQMGFNAKLTLDKAGYYPPGGGRISAVIRPVPEVLPLDVSKRGDIQNVFGISGYSNLHRSIAERQKRQTLLRLQNLPWNSKSPDIRIKVTQYPSPSKGTFLLLVGDFKGGRCCFYGLGALGKSAEKVADEAVDALFEFLDTGGAVDHYLADQLILPACLADGETKIFTSKVTNHLQTNAEIIESFLPQVKINIDGELGDTAMIQVDPGS